MTKAEVVRLALEAGFYIDTDHYAFEVTTEMDSDHNTESWLFADGSTLHLTFWPHGELEYSTGNAGEKGIQEYERRCSKYLEPSE